MNKEVQKELLASGSAALTEFAHAARTTGEHLYSVLVRQQMVEGIADLILIPVSAILICFFTKKFWDWSMLRKKEDSYNDMFLFTPAIAVVVFLGVLLFMAGMESAIGKLINPEYYAIKFIFDSIKGR